MTNSTELSRDIFDSLPSTWFEARITFEQIRYHFQAGKKEIRIASGFFTIKGWGLIRKSTEGKHVYLLVGIDDPGEERARKALINDIMRDLRTGLDRERRQAVYDLVQKMAVGQFHIFDARAMNHHAKLYLIDRNIAIITSANTTGRGFIEQIESGTLETKRNKVSALVNKFDEYFAQAKDITQEILEALQRWLDFARPWDIYLKTMLALEDLQPVKANYKKQPVSYQVDMITQTLRHIREFGGSMLVASTGLGKTVVAVHVALHLHQEGEIDNVMIIGPKPVRDIWKREMRNAGIPGEYFIRQAFDKESSAHDGSIELFEEIAENIHEQRWLLIIDESHQFRNRYKQDLFNMKKHPTEAQAFVRLQTLFQKSNIKRLLLTGSPYAKNIDNINNQLYLLPHTSEPRALFPEFVDNERSWFINEADEFIHLKVASQLTTPHVAKYYGQTDSEGIYINFGEEKRYIPKVRLHSINFPLSLETEITAAIVNGYFALNSRKPMFRKCIEKLVKVAWASSPWAIRGVLERVIDTPGGTNKYDFKKLQFVVTRYERQQILAPIIDRLKGENFESDIKLKALCRILQTLQPRTEKALVFCERRATVVYLKQALTELMPLLRVAVTINKMEDDYQMKETKEIEKLIKQFAPVANDGVVKDEENYDVFISTDAHGVGVNMQDASVVINYDIDWTPIGPVQRAGRILRFWHSPRTVEVYTFVPTLTDKTTLQYDLLGVMRRWENLIARHGESRKFTDLPVLTAGNTQEINMSDVASKVTIRSGQLDLEDLADLDISPYYQHTAKLQLNRDYAKSIPSDIISAKTYGENTPSIYVLLNYDSKYHGLVYNPKTKQLREPDIVKLLELISCSENTEIAFVDFEQVEQLSDACIQAWCEQEGINPEEVVRECALYLKPEGEGDNVNDWLNPQEENRG